GGPGCPFSCSQGVWAGHLARAPPRRSPCPSPPARPRPRGCGAAAAEASAQRLLDDEPIAVGLHDRLGVRDHVPGEDEEAVGLAAHALVVVLAKGDLLRALGVRALAEVELRALGVLPLGPGRHPLVRGLEQGLVAGDALLTLAGHSGSVAAP